MKKEKNNWGTEEEKPIFSPSKLADFGCGLKFYLRWIKRVAIRQRLTAPPTLGTLVHAGEAAIDLGRNGKEGIKESVLKIAKALHFTEDSPLLFQLSSEAESIVLGKPFADGKGVRKTPESYEKWVARQQEANPWEVLAVEKRLMIDAGPLILAPQIDLAIEDELGLWVVERKTKTSLAQDKGWWDKFRLNGQLLTQMLAAEFFFKKPVRGAMVRAVPYSRQNKKDWTSDLPQGLSNVRRMEPAWIRKSTVTESFFIDLLASIRATYEKRLRENSWPAEGLTNGMCRICDYQRFCRGEVPSKDLVPLPPDDISIAEEKREEKGKQKALRKK